MSLRRNAFANLAGTVAQVAVTFVTLPFYVRAIGAERYGILALVILVIGYFGLFDLGLGRALTYLLPKIADPRERATAFRTALCLNGALAVVGALIFAFGVPPLLLHAIGMRAEIAAEAARALPILGLGVGVALFSSSITGALAGRERFAELNLWQAVGAALGQVLPLAVAYMTGPSLEHLVTALVISRFVASIPLALAAIRIVPLDRYLTVRRRYLGELLRFGGWVTISNIISPVLVLVDRFVIGTLAGAASVAVYTIPFNVASKLLLIPSAISQAVFPRFSASDPDEVGKLADRAVAFITVVVTPLSVVGILLMRPFLEAWVGPHLGDLGAPVGEVMMLGIWLNCIAFIPYAAIQGLGRPRLTAIFHMVELPPYLAVLWFGVGSAGITGAAWAWTARIGIDLVLLSGSLRTAWHHTPPVCARAAILVVAALALVITDPHLNPARVSISVFLFGFSGLFAATNAPTELRMLLRRVLGSERHTAPIGGAKK